MGSVILIMLITITGISKAAHFTDMGEHTVLYKINKNVYIKPQK